MVAVVDGRYTAVPMKSAAAAESASTSIASTTWRTTGLKVADVMGTPMFLH
jgi:hypothetical protein